MISEEEYKKELQAKRENDRADNALKNIQAFLADNQAICDRAYDYYIEAEEHYTEYLSTPIALTPDIFREKLPEKTILVVTVNRIETCVFTRWLYEQNGARKLDCFSIDKLMVLTTYSFSDDTMIIHIAAKEIGENDTRRRLNKIRTILTPTYIFMLGVCYGLDMKYSLGSVFISKEVYTYRLNFRDSLESDETDFEVVREQTGIPDKDLISQIEDLIAIGIGSRSIVNDDDHPTVVTVQSGSFLSSNSLISSRKVKQKVVSKHCNVNRPLGGEMEAAGILNSYIVEGENYRNWVIIKSVCDWGEKKNALDPDENRNKMLKNSLQAFAMTNTCGTFQSILRYL